VRSFAAVGGTPYTVERGEGPWVFDVEGNRYLDLVQSYGAVLLGHGHRAVVDAVRAAAGRGTTFGAPTRGEVLLAEAITERVPGCEQVRFVSSGTEATMSALRLARGVTGRDRVVKFDGCYHGHADALLAGSGSGVATLGLPGSAGVPAGAVADTLVVPFNVVPEIDERVACVIVEPVAANMNLVAPADGFLAALRSACDAAGALLIFDEVITGFRLAAGGAAAHFGVVPDLWCFGKVIGGGLPLAALGGPAELLGHLAPLGPVYQAGTLSGNPLATAAGLAALGEIGPQDHQTLAGRVARLAERLRAAISGGGLTVATPAVGPLLGLFVGPPDAGLGTPVDYAGARDWAAGGAYAPFFGAMLRRGVALAPGPYEILFPGFAHGEAEFDFLVEAAGEAAAEVAADLGAASSAGARR
jgi:glutamate-1-semialdehyde 2,1-aminomutase